MAWTLRSHQRVTAGELRRRSTFATKGRLANMSMTTTMRWGRVEYQLDLRTPQRPVPLGVVVLAEKASRVHSILAGKAPRPGFTPEELKSVGPLGRSQLDGWVAAMAKDLLGSLEKREDPLETLASIWCWNLRVVVEPDTEAQHGQTVRDVTGRLYTRHVGVPLPHESFEQTQTAATAAGDWTVTEVAYDTR
ncbi:MAG TPA: hypothetical protein VE932_16005 [Patescibacteria group bacterium]|nr:hypothetical protein [Patescibacteria group bacterium]